MLIRNDTIIVYREELYSADDDEYDHAHFSHEEYKCTDRVHRTDSHAVSEKGVHCACAASHQITAVDTYRDGIHINVIRDVESVSFADATIRPLITFIHSVVKFMGEIERWEMWECVIKIQLNDNLHIIM